MAEEYDTQAIFRLEDAHTSGGMGRRPVAIVRGSGAALFDSEGRTYIDMAAAQGWANLGHGHPAVTQAIQEQAARLVAHTESSYNDQRAGWFAELSDLLGEAFGASEKGALTRIHPCLEIRGQIPGHQTNKSPRLQKGCHLSFSHLTPAHHEDPLISNV